MVFRNKNIGVKDVAKAANVSPATVSRVLAGRKVDDEMAKRVITAVKALDYRPNMAARRLRSRNSNTIGLIVADIRNPFFTAISRAIEDAAYANNMRVILCNTDENPEREKLYLKYMKEEGVTGVILAPTRQSTKKIAEDVHDFPVILIDRSPRGQSHDSVVLDNEQALSQLVNHLYERGYRNIVGLFGAGSITGQERHNGYINAMRDLNLEPDGIYIKHGQYDDTISDILSQQKSNSKAPLALITSNGLMMANVVRAAQRSCVTIPDDMAIAGFDNDIWTEFVAGGITLIEQPVEEIGRSAVTMLLERLKKSDLPARKIILAGKLLIRGSTPIKK